MNAVVKIQEQQLVHVQERQLTAVDLRAQVNLVQEVMKAVMKDGTHYGTIPGCGDKKSLFKPGAEVLGATFRIAPSYLVEDLSTIDVARYRVRCIGTHQTSGIVMGEGMGECSTGEEKYKWRKAYDEEFNATPEDRKRIKYGKYNTKQVRTEPADLANTALKMACKRAQVAMTLNVTAASDIFTQDIEDLPEELRPTIDPETGEVTGKREVKPEYLAEEVFGEQKAVWCKSIESGKKTAAAVIAWIEAKGVLVTAEQRSEIEGWTVQPAKTPDADDPFLRDMKAAEMGEPGAAG